MDDKLTKDIAINREKLKNLILKLYNYRDKINKILNDVEVLADNTKQYYLSDDGDYYRQKFSILCSNKNVILQNIKSYCDDLEKVIKKFDVIQQKSIDLFK